MAEPLFGEVPIGIGFEIPQQTYQPPQSSYSRFTNDNTMGTRQNQRQFRVASSLYSATPNPNVSTVNGPSTTPRASLRGLWGPRPSNRSVMPSPNGSRAHLPANCQVPATSYSPASQSSEWDAQEDVVTSRIPLSGARSHPDLAARMMERSTENLVNPTVPSTDISSSRPTGSGTEAASRRRKKHKRRHHQQRAWVRHHRPGTSPVRTRNTLHSKAMAKNHGVSVVVAALFLAATVITYLAIALSVKPLAQELHILFALTIAGSLIFLIHSLVRFLAARKRRAARRRVRVNAKQLAKAGPSFAPLRPIRVHMVQDEEVAAEPEAEHVVHEKVAVKIPPPAYGLWRSSVKVNPELLFWHRVEPPRHASVEMREPESAEGQRRPPSYISDDGVSYVVEAEPRSVVSVQRPPSQLHPAYRH